MLTGCSPFAADTKQETFCNISQINVDYPEDLFEDISSHAVDFISKLLVRKPRYVVQSSGEHGKGGLHVILTQAAILRTSLQVCVYFEMKVHGFLISLIAVSE